MDPMTIAAALAATRELIRFIAEQVALAQQRGELTPEQVEAIKAKARVSDADFDDAVAEAKRRLES